MKIKNIYRETFKKHDIILTDEYLPKISGYNITSGFIHENGTDLVDGEERRYLILKVYMEEKNDRQK